ncbi:glycosyl hydrolase 115 family protein [Paenibacillus kobensis]|uniref:glycosyl hydrolase 115 family protein n=1 Tax=Paenibacillus kobensis TaxID=59841 RepID=UPI000FDBB485|nr:glycosyl hydrolase 115 family protein [Paenibacillus kobensis]
MTRPTYVQFIDNREEASFALAHNGQAAELIIGSGEFEGVARAGSDLQQDIQRVTGLKPDLNAEWSGRSKRAVIIGTIGRGGLIDELAASGKLDAADTAGKWESFVIQTVAEPVPGLAEALVIAGSDKRGTIFGIYDVSEAIGVSPWYWWADVPAVRRDSLFVCQGTYKQGEPSVKYRGIYINDEGPSMMAWVRERYGDFVSGFYEKVFELLLRLKANYLWPAMRDNAFNEDDEENPRLADRYGIVMGTSPHEPMTRSHGEWKSGGQGAWNDEKNGEFLRKFWEHGVKRNRNYESIVTLGMRGDGDESMDEQPDIVSKIKLLERIVADQRAILAEHVSEDVAQVPQLWVLDKEMQDYYESGMHVPDDVTLLWSDDNHGNLRRLPTPEERSRSGGAGIYYHLDYAGGPRSYKWINVMPLQKMWEQMNKAYEFGADRIWILNVGGLKPMELPIDYFLRMGWDMPSFTKDNVHSFIVSWAASVFGDTNAEEIAWLLAMYTKLNGRIKPENINMAETYSPVHSREAEDLLSVCSEMRTLADQLYMTMPDHLRDAFFELVYHPVHASVTIVELYIAASYNKRYAEQGRAAANLTAATAERLFRRDAELTFDYNNRVALGKWNHLMDQKHIGYTYWNCPERNIMSEVRRVSAGAEAKLGVAVEESAEAWPGAEAECRLPQLDPDTRPAAFVELFNRGEEGLGFHIAADCDWLKLDVTEGSLLLQKRVAVSADWEQVPAGKAVSAVLMVTGSCGTEVQVTVPVYQPAQSERETMTGFLERDGVVAIEAEHYARKSEGQDGAGWERIDGYGRTLSSMAVFPVTALTPADLLDAPHLEYDVYLRQAGDYETTAIVAPTLDCVLGGSVRIGFSLDDGPIVIADAVKRSEDGGFHEHDWEHSVIVSKREAKVMLHAAAAGAHVLKVWMVDSITVLQKLVMESVQALNERGRKHTYLGPAESARGTGLMPPPEEDSLHLQVAGPWDDGGELQQAEWLDREERDSKLLIRPTLRLENGSQSSGVIAQIGVYNSQPVAYEIKLTAELHDEYGASYGSAITFDQLPRDQWKLYNIGFQHGSARTCGDLLLSVKISFSNCVLVREYRFPSFEDEPEYAAQKY